MKQMKLSALILDFSLYPRGEIDNQHAHYIQQAMESGTEMPPIVIDRKSRRIIDGFHRHRAYLKRFDEHHEVEVIEKTYKGEAEMFIDAMRFNAGHGRALSTYDRAHCLVRADELGITPEQIADALHLTSDALGEIRSGRLGLLNGGAIPIKRTISHMAGKSLTREQQEANGKLSGMHQLFYVNQLLLLIDNDLVMTENEQLMSGLVKLRGALEKILRSEAA